MKVETGNWKSETRKTFEARELPVIAEEYVVTVIPGDAKNPRICRIVEVRRSFVACGSSG